MATFSQVLSTLGVWTEHKVILWTEVNSTTYRYITAGGYTITITGANDQNGDFNGSVTCTDASDVPLTELDTDTEPSSANLLRWLHNNARIGTSNIDQIIEDFANEQV